MKKQNNEKENKKDAGNNQWINTHRNTKEDHRKRRDGPGGN
jgi:hypothetical protein